MRTVALHITRCPDCEGELRSLEALQGLVAQQVSSFVDEIDVDSIWRVVSNRIDDAPYSWTQRVAAWWEGLFPLNPAAAWPALAAAAAVFLAVSFLTGDVAPIGVEVAGKAPVEIAERVAQVGRAERLFQEAMDEVDNSAVFESIVGGFEGLMIEPKTQTAVLWIHDNGEFR